MIAIGITLLVLGSAWRLLRRAERVTEPFQATEPPRSCTRPSRDNPFANPSAFDAEFVRCSDDIVFDDVQAAFDLDVLKGGNRLASDFTLSLRPFHSIPHHIYPHNLSRLQSELRSDLEKSCKANEAACYFEENPRAKRFVEIRGAP